MFNIIVGVSESEDVLIGGNSPFTLAYQLVSIDGVETSSGLGTERFI